MNTEMIRDFRQALVQRHEEALAAIDKVLSLMDREKRKGAKTQRRKGGPAGE